MSVDLPMLPMLPMAVAIALTPLAVILAVVLLLTPRPRATAGAFLGGWALGVAAVTGIAVAAADLIDVYVASPRWAVWVQLLLGVALVGLGIGRWRMRHRSAGTPAWLQGVQSIPPRRAFALGLMASAANPKVLMLGLAGGIAIGSAAGHLLAEALGVLGFTAVSSLGAAVPWLAFLVCGERAVRTLMRVRAWLEANADTMVALVFMVLGIALAAGGLARL